MKGKDIEIPLSKAKLILFAAVMAIVMVVGVFLFLASFEQKNKLPPIVFQIMGILCFLFSVFFEIPLIKKIFDSKPGLILNNEGIQDNSAMLVGERFIPWKEITGFDAVEIESAQLLVILVRDPQIFLHHPKAYVQKMLQGSFNRYGSPIILSDNSLKTNFDNLCQTLIRSWEKTKSSEAKERL